MMDVAIDLKLNAKMMDKQAAKIEAQEKATRKKILDALNKGQTENAKIFAETAISSKKEAQNTRRFAAKMGALSMKIESAARTQQMSEQLKSSVPALTTAMKQMEKMGVAGSVAEFEKVFEDMEVKTGEIGQAMDNVMATSTDATEVEALLGEISSAHVIGEGGVIQGQKVGMGAIANPAAQEQVAEMDDIQKRMDALK